MADSVEQQLIADNMALYAVVRALADANSDNPKFATALNNAVELRMAKLITSQVSDKSIEMFKQAVRDLLPEGLRKI